MRFFVEGKPVGKERPRFNARTRTTYTPSKTKQFEKLVATECAAHMLEHKYRKFETPCLVNIDVSVGIPKSYSKKKRENCYLGIEKPVKKPDIDNIAKSVLDGLNGVAYEDDKQVVGLTINKYWGYIDGVYVEIIEDE